MDHHSVALSEQRLAMLHAPRSCKATIRALTMLLVLAGTVAAVMMSSVGTAAASTASDTPTQAHLVSDNADVVGPVPAAQVKEVGGARTGSQTIAPLGSDCGYPLCGRVYNATDNYIDLSQNYTDSGGCVGPYAALAPGQYSYKNPYKDTDCVAAVYCNFTVDGWGPFNASTWVRIHDLPWTQDVKCA